MSDHRLAHQTVALMALLVLLPLACMQNNKPKDAAHEERIPATDLPASVMSGLKSRFPHPEIDQANKETEKGVVVYDLEFRQEGRKYEADVKEDGTIVNWERAISAAELPAAARAAIDQKYPQAPIKDVMAVTEVKNGQDSLEGYEVTIQNGDKEIEVTVAPDGRFLEQPGKGE